MTGASAAARASDEAHMPSAAPACNSRRRRRFTRSVRGGVICQRPGLHQLRPGGGVLARDAAHAEAMAAAIEDVQFAANTGATQRLEHHQRILDGHGVVVGRMDQQGRAACRRPRADAARSARAARRSRRRRAAVRRTRHARRPRWWRSPGTSTPRNPDARRDRPPHRRGDSSASGSVMSRATRCPPAENPMMPRRAGAVPGAAPAGCAAGAGRAAHRERVHRLPRPSRRRAIDNAAPRIRNPARQTTARIRSPPCRGPRAHSRRPAR